MDANYPIYAFFAIATFSFVHLFAEKTRRLDTPLHRRFLSTGSGVAIAYVFIDLLPKLEKSNSVLKASFNPSFPYFEKHVYVLALMGFLFFFMVDRSQKVIKNPSVYFNLSLSSYAFFNFLVGYAVNDPLNTEVRPLALFTFAMALHYFVNDYSMSLKHGRLYHAFGKWVLVGSLFAGWLIGLSIELSKSAIALVSAFIGGGVIMNVMRHELPEENPNSSQAFLLACFLYTLVLLLIGTG